MGDFEGKKSKNSSHIGKHPDSFAIDQREIEDASPDKAELMLHFNEELKIAEERGRLNFSRTPEMNENGWSISLVTEKGVVGLWFSWLGNALYLGYPLDQNLVPTQKIIETLDVEKAKPVLNSDGKREMRGQFCGPRLANDGGRFYVDVPEKHSHARTFQFVSQNGELSEVCYGWDRSRHIESCPFSSYSEDAPDLPNGSPEVVMTYRDRFFNLAQQIAQEMGGIKEIVISYDTLVLIPQQLESSGFENITWLGGNADVRVGYGKELVRAETKGPFGQEAVFLRSGNSMVPWSTTRCITPQDDVESIDLSSLLMF